MNLRILLVNPWIFDFSAYNFWSRPLGLLKVAEYLSQFNVEIMLIDCVDAFSIKRYGTGKFKAEIVKKPELLKDIPLFYRRYGISIDEFVDRLKASMPFDIVVLTSIMSYWYPGVKKTVEIIRDVAGDVPIILGGIYATLYHEHASENSGADFIYKGPLNNSLSFVFHTFGYRLKKKREPIAYYKLGLYKEYPFAPLLTAEGCPYQCSYCASRLLVNRYHRRPVEDILQEIKELYSLGIQDYAFYDDALLADRENHIKPILKAVIDSKLKVRFHTPNGLHARFIDQELAGLMKAANFKTLRLSLETVDSNRQIRSGGKVNNEDLERAVRNLKQQGFTKNEIGVYLMYGLPGQPLEEVKKGIDFLKRLGVHINLTEFSPIKGTGSWNDLVNMGIIDNDLDPLLTNNSVFSYLYGGYNLEDLRKIKLDVKEYNSL